MSIDLSAPEVQDAIKSAVEDQVSQLKAKNAELISEVRKLRKGAEVDPQEVEQLRGELEAATGKIQDLTKQAKTFQADAEKFRKQAEAESGYTSKLLIENGLNEALTKAGVKPEYLKAAKAMLSSNVQLKQDGESRQPVIGDKALQDFVAEWSKGDEGKHFVAAPVNSGGGANGGRGGGAAKTMPRSEFEGLNPAQRMDFARSGGQLTD